MKLEFNDAWLIVRLDAFIQNKPIDNYFVLDYVLINYLFLKWFKLNYPKFNYIQC
jgi:hypothetical protein